jgi:hypothetical protein
MLPSGHSSFPCVLHALQNATCCGMEAGIVSGPRRFWWRYCREAHVTLGICHLVLSVCFASSCSSHFALLEWVVSTAWLAQPLLVLLSWELLPSFRFTWSMQQLNRDQPLFSLPLRLVGWPATCFDLFLEHHLNHADHGPNDYLGQLLLILPTYYITYCCNKVIDEPLFSCAWLLFNGAGDLVPYRNVTQHRQAGEIVIVLSIGFCEEPCRGPAA